MLNECLVQVKVLVLWLKGYGYIVFENGQKWAFGKPREICVQGSFRPQMLMKTMHYVMLMNSRSFGVMSSYESWFFSA